MGVPQANASRDPPRQARQASNGAAAAVGVRCIAGMVTPRRAPASGGAAFAATADNSSAGCDGGVPRIWEPMQRSTVAGWGERQDPRLPLVLEAGHAPTQQADQRR